MGWVVKDTPRPLYPRERKSDIHCTADWVGTRAGLNACRKISPTPRPDPRTVQPVTSRDAGPVCVLLKKNFSNGTDNMASAPEFQMVKSV